MRWILSIYIGWLSSFNCAFAESIDASKSKIADCLIELEQANKKQKEDLYLNLTLAYLKDQDLERAFLTFLEGLDSIEPLTLSEIQPEDQRLYDEALKIYLEHNGPTVPSDNAERILSLYQPVIENHPDFYLLKFIVAAAHANLGHFAQFFEEFYSVYKHFPSHYMAFKTKAVVHLKIYERARDPKFKELHRNALLANVKKAIFKNRDDPGLYKLIMVFASEKEQQQAIVENLQLLVQNKIRVPRADVAFFVQQALNVKRPDLAQSIIDNARDAYTYSRVIIAAQEYLENWKGKITHE
jgi:hypothetical protein